ncbi:MAG TPA: hypothetical protein VFC12_06980, partial [Terriglobales bacterium]|nr:hypothetical protein [Terriglobales bacterium]
VAVGPTNPTARIEYALRADEALSEPQVRQVMEYYLAVRMRRFGRIYANVRSEDRPLDPRRPLEERRDTPMLSVVAAGQAMRSMQRPMLPRARPGREQG